MSVSITSVNTAADTFLILITRVNECINAISTVVVTANTNANGSITTGNSFVVGIFGSNTMVATTLRGGNVQSSANLAITSNVSFSGVNYNFTNNTVAIQAGNTSINTTSVSTNSASISNNINLGNNRIGYFTNTINTTSTVELDNFLLSEYRAADYFISIKDNNANNYHSSRLMALHDGTTATFTEFAVLYTNTHLVTFSVSANTTHFLLNYTSVSANTTVKLTKNLISV